MSLLNDQDLLRIARLAILYVEARRDADRSLAIESEHATWRAQNQWGDLFRAIDRLPANQRCRAICNKPLMIGGSS